MLFIFCPELIIFIYGGEDSSNMYYSAITGPFLRFLPVFNVYQFYLHICPRPRRGRRFSRKGRSAVLSVWVEPPAELASRGGLGRSGLGRSGLGEQGWAGHG